MDTVKLKFYKRKLLYMCTNLEKRKTPPKPQKSIQKTWCLKYKFLTPGIETKARTFRFSVSNGN